jgi:hypothetical protein
MAFATSYIPHKWATVLLCTVRPTVAPKGVVQENSHSSHGPGIHLSERELCERLLHLGVITD